jgi:hypothetical protein
MASRNRITKEGTGKQVRDHTRALDWNTDFISTSYELPLSFSISNGRRAAREIPNATSTEEILSITFSGVPSGRARTGAQGCTSGGESVRTKDEPDSPVLLL